MTDEDIREAAKALQWNGDPDWIRKAAAQGDAGYRSILTHAHTIAKLRIAREALEAHEGLYAWLLHRFGPFTPEGNEADCYAKINRTALAQTEPSHD